MEVCLSVVDDFEVSPLPDLLLWQLTAHPFKHFLP